MLEFGKTQNTIVRRMIFENTGRNTYQVPGGIIHTLTDPTLPAAASGQSLGVFLLVGLPSADSLDIFSAKNRRADAAGDIIVGCRRITLTYYSYVALNAEVVTRCLLRTSAAYTWLYEYASSTRRMSNKNISSLTVTKTLVLYIETLVVQKRQ